MSKGNVKKEITKTTSHQNNTPQNDDCSPFCQCACCAGFSINHFIAAITIIPPYKSTTQEAYLPANILDVALPIWQPPQLV